MIVLLGPTAGGKSGAAVAMGEALADRGGAAIVGADSMQVYRHMDAGTAKPTAAQRARVTHHLIDIVAPSERFTVADWLGRAEPIVDGLLAAGRWPIVVGGTNLYLKALLEGMFEGPEADPALRERLEATPARQLHERLQTIDPDAADRIHVNDTKRLVRAIEVYETAGQPISELQQQWRDEASQTTYRRDPILIGLDWPRDAINQRINLRVKAMFYPDKVDADLAAETCPNGESLPDETARLDAAGLLGAQAREALGYKQVLAALRGQTTMADAFEQTKIHTRRFAKSQRTWLRRYRGVNWVDATGEGVVDAAVGVVTGAE